MRRLYVQIYLSVVAVALIVVAGAFFWTRYSLRVAMENLPAELEHVATLIAEDLPGPDASRDVLSAYLREQKKRHRARASLWSREGELLATSRGEGDPPPPDRRGPRLRRPTWEGPFDGPPRRPPPR